MSSAAASFPPPPEPGAVRLALADIPGIAEARLAYDQVYVILATHDVARDDLIVAAMLAIDFHDFHLVPLKMAGAVPDGIRAV